MAEAAALLVPELRAAGRYGLLIADENCLTFPFAELPEGQAVLTNRYDIAELAKRVSLDVHFSDFDTSPWSNAALELIAYRISKEKSVVHHIANQAALRLVPGGQLLLVGGKQEGIKTFAKTIGDLLGGTTITEKHGALYRVTIERDRATPDQWLDDHHYPSLREIFRLNDKAVLSKPGLYGWNKEDEGSALLADNLTSFFDSIDRQPESLLDMGCGYGYLSLKAAAIRPLTITATDNCAAAIMACEQNFKVHGIRGQVVADDCGASIRHTFDTVVCNPPFHQGFQEDRRLTEKFLSQTRHLLRPGGRALFVVNGFVPLEKLAERWFQRIRVPVNTGRFKLVSLG